MSPNLLYKNFDKMTFSEKVKLLQILDKNHQPLYEKAIKLLIIIASFLITWKYILFPYYQLFVATEGQVTPIDMWFKCLLWIAFTIATLHHLFVSNIWESRKNKKMITFIQKLIISIKIKYIVDAIINNKITQEEINIIDNIYKYAGISGVNGIEINQKDFPLLSIYIEKQEKFKKIKS